MKCDKCGISMMDDPLYRINPKGEDGIFRCESCMKKFGQTVDKDLKKIVDTIYNDNKKVVQ